MVHLSPAATSPGWLSPGLCGAGCAVQGGGRGGGCEEGALGRSMRRQRRSAPCAWSAAVVLPRIHAQPQAEMMRPNSGVPPHSPAQGAACSARGAQRREPGPREPDAREQYARGLRSRSRSCATPQGRGSSSAPERGDDDGFLGGGFRGFCIRRVQDRQNEALSAPSRVPDPSKRPV